MIVISKKKTTNILLKNLKFQGRPWPFLAPSPPVHNGEGRQAMGDLGLKKSPYPLAILIKIKFYLTPTPPKIKILSLLLFV